MFLPLDLLSDPLSLILCLDLLPLVLLALDLGRVDLGFLSGRSLLDAGFGEGHARSLAEDDGVGPFERAAETTTGDHDGDRGFLNEVVGHGSEDGSVKRERERESSADSIVNTGQRRKRRGKSLPFQLAQSSRADDDESRVQEVDQVEKKVALEERIARWFVNSLDMQVKRVTKVEKRRTEFLVWIAWQKTVTLR
jgi:hypothetical protein